MLLPLSFSLWFLANLGGYRKFRVMLNWLRGGVPHDLTPLEEPAFEHVKLSNLHTVNGLSSIQFLLIASQTRKSITLSFVKYLKVA